MNRTTKNHKEHIQQYIPGYIRKDNSKKTGKIPVRNPSRYHNSLANAKRFTKKIKNPKGSRKEKPNYTSKRITCTTLRKY